MMLNRCSSFVGFLGCLLIAVVGIAIPESAYAASCTYTWQRPFGDCTQQTDGSWKQFRSGLGCWSGGYRVDCEMCDNYEQYLAANESQSCTPPYTYSWSAGSFGACAPGGTGTWGYGAWTPTTGCGEVTQTRSASCSPNANSSYQTRAVTCMRSDGAPVGDENCDAGGKPVSTNACTPSSGYSCGAQEATSLQVKLTNSCSYSWDVGAWGAYASSCSDHTTRERAVSCRQSNGEIVADALCVANVGAKPATSEGAANFAGCQYDWVASDFGACTGGTAHWQYGAWTPPAGCGMTEQSRSSSCVQDAGSGTQARTVSCRRTATGSIVDNSLCAGAAPALTQSCTPTGASCGPADSTRYELLSNTCGYSWVVGSWSAPAESCSISAPITRAVSCRRDDGETVDDALCAGAGLKPDSSSTTPAFGGCSYSWSEPTWGAWSSTCSVNATRSRAPACQRSDEVNTIVADGFCDAGSRPQSEQTQEVTTSCTWNWETQNWGACLGGTFSWMLGEWDPTAGCGEVSQFRTVSCSIDVMSGIQSRVVLCRRADGNVRPDFECALSGPKPDLASQCTPDASVCGPKPASYRTVELSNSCGNARVMSVCRPGTDNGKLCVISQFK